MRLDILGSNGTYPAASGACSGYLLSHDGFNIWMDAGTGTMARLLEKIPIEEVHTLFLSHMHADHFVDVYPLFYGLWFHPDRPKPPPVLAPRGSFDFVGRIMSEDAKEGLGQALDWNVLGAGDAVEVGPFAIRVFDSYHSAENLTIRVEAGGKVFCYSGDTGPNPALAKAAEDADLFLCEASWQRDTDAIDDPIHLRAHEAGNAARAAGAKRLMLTHIWPNLNLGRTQVEAEETYGDAVEIALIGNGTEV